MTLPRRVRIPPEQVVTQLPAPYDTAIDGPFSDLSVPPVAPLSTPLLPRRTTYHRTGSIDAYPGEMDAGVQYPYASTNAAGIYLVNEWQDIQIDEWHTQQAPDSIGGSVIYAPTSLPQSACLETTQLFQRAKGAFGTTHAFGFWDWCTDRGGSGPGGTDWAATPQDAANAQFTLHYVRSFFTTNQPGFLTEMASDHPQNPSTGCWYGFIYDYNDGQWDQIAKVCSSAGLSHSSATSSYTAWESWGWYEGGCTSIPSVGASSIITRGTDGTWYGLGLGAPANAFSTGGTCFPGIYSLNYPWPGSGVGTNSWWAKTS